MSPPSHYVEEAVHLLPLLEPDSSRRLSLLELGAGGGSLAFHLGRDFELTLTDRSPEMQAVSRVVNPEADHLIGDLRTLDLGRQFDRVLLHDAVMYLLTETELAQGLATCRRHCRPDGRVVILPDCVLETFEPETSWGGEDGSNGEALRYLEWSWDPDPHDTQYDVYYALVLRDPAGRIRVEGDHQRNGLFPRATWNRLIEEAGFTVTTVQDPWRQDVFVARPAHHRVATRSV